MSTFPGVFGPYMVFRRVFKHARFRTTQFARENGFGASELQSSAIPTFRSLLAPKFCRHGRPISPVEDVVRQLFGPWPAPFGRSQQLVPRRHAKGIQGKGGGKPFG